MPIFRDGLLSQLEGLLDGRPSRDSFIPSPVVLKFLVPIELIRKYHMHCRLPGNEGNVGIRRLVTNKILLVCQDAIKHANHTESLLLITLDCTLNLLRVKHLEPSILPVIWSLARDLEVQVLLLVVLVGQGCRADLVILVVGVNQVLNDSTGLPERDTRVWVLDGRYTTIGVNLGVGLLFDIGL